MENGWQLRLVTALEAVKQGNLMVELYGGLYRRWRVPIHDLPEIWEAESGCATSRRDRGLDGVRLTRLTRFPNGSGILWYELLGGSVHLRFWRLNDQRFRRYVHVIIQDSNVVKVVIIDCRAAAKQRPVVRGARRFVIGI